MHDTPEEYFKHCFVEPLDTLRRMPEGKGAVVALATALFLFERYWTVLPKPGRAQSPSDQIARDFNVSTDEAAAFWHIFRDGLLHLASPMQADRAKTWPAYSMRPKAPKFLDFEDIAGVRTLIVNPWTFCDRVLALWQTAMPAVDTNKSAPLPKRYREITDYFTNSQCPSVTRLVEEP